MNVLVCEDEAVSRRILESLLPMWGYSVTSTSTVAEAWNVLQQPDAPRFAILDWMMPDTDGLELVRRIREDAALKYVYIILVTAKDSRADLVRGLDAGVDDYLVKPFDPLELRGRMDAARRALNAYDEIEQLANELSRKNKQLAQLTDTAHRFVDDVSHEFRTPLTVIKEFTSIIADGLGGPVTDDQQNYLQTITNSVHDLAQMVDDLLDSSKLKAGTLRIDRRDHTLSDIVNGVGSMVAANAKSKKIDLQFDVDEETVVFADRNKALRVIVNLIVNAIKFSPEGSTVRLASGPTPDGQIEIAISDEGPGLTPEDLARIFERFAQAGSVSESSTKGFGLGLSIVRELAWLNLGQVRVESTLGVGSTFAFTLPPNRTDLVLRQYLTRISELTEPRPHLALLSVTPMGATPEDLRCFVAAASYATDLVLPAANGRAILALGLTDAADGWRDRLLSQRERLAQEHRGNDLVGIDVDILDAWPSSDLQAAIPGVLASAAEGLICA